MSAIAPLFGLFMTLTVGRFALWLATCADGHGWEYTGTLTTTQWRQARTAQWSAMVTALVFGVVGLYGLVDSVRDLVATI